MTIESHASVLPPRLTEADMEGMTLQERREALCAVSLARAQEAHRLSLLNPTKEPRPLRYGRIRNNWQNAYD